MSMPSQAELNETLIAIIRDLSLETATQPTFRVGRQFSNFKLSMQSTLNQPLAVKYIGRAMFEMALMMEDEYKLHQVRRIGAVNASAVAVTTAMLTATEPIRGDPMLHGFYVERGAVTGLPVNRGTRHGSILGKPVILVETLASNGKIGLRAADAIEAAGGILVSILAVVDLGNQASRVYKKRGIAFKALFHAPTHILLPGFQPVTHWPKRHK